MMFAIFKENYTATDMNTYFENYKNGFSGKTPLILANFMKPSLIL